MEDGILNSILDNDFYKFTMQNAVIKLFPRVLVQYKFINRGNHPFPAGFAKALKGEVEKMTDLRLSKEEKDYLIKNFPYLDPTYIDFLSGFRYDPSEVKISQAGTDIGVHIEGYWYRTILWEVPLMALISELYYKLQNLKRKPDSEVKELAKKKIELYRNLEVKIAEFGTRRRHSFYVHHLIVDTLKEFGGATFTGTSNVALAKEFAVKAIGTHAHEWFMFHAAKFGFKMANQIALENWVNIYRGDLGIALSDTYTTEVFFESFDKKLSKLFDGVRQDSGDPISFAKATIAHYKSLNIDPISKTIIFSDALYPEKVREIAAFCKNKIGMSFGIGTNFTNDVGLEPMNIVIKMCAADPDGRRWIPVVKLSDAKGKYTGDDSMIDLSRTILNLEG